MVPLPTLDEIASDPSRGLGLPRHVAAKLAMRALTALNALAVQAAIDGADTEPAPAQEAEERYLDAGEVAKLLGCSKSWVHHHTDALPQRRSVAGKRAKWLRSDVLAWMRTRPKRAA